MVRLLGSQDEFTQLEAAKVAVTIISNASKTPLSDMTPLFDWLANNLRSDNPQIQDLTVQYLGAVLGPVPVRKSAYAHQLLIPNLLDLLKTGNANAQMQYQIVYCFWLLSFIPEIASDMQPRLAAIPVFTDVAKSAIKEKVTRIILATFKNMAVRAPGATMLPMIGAKTLPFLQNLSARKWTDQEIVEDIDMLKNELTKNVANLTWVGDEPRNEAKRILLITRFVGSLALSQNLGRIRSRSKIRPPRMVPHPPIRRLLENQRLPAQRQGPRNRPHPLQNPGHLDRPHHARRRGLGYRAVCKVHPGWEEAGAGDWGKDEDHGAHDESECGCEVPGFVGDTKVHG